MPTSTPLSVSPSHIAVIGAGMAGLSCAQALHSAGLHVSVFDKSRGVAGRMSTRRAEGWQCDHGVPYFTAQDPVFEAQVQRWVEAGVAAPWPLRMAVLDGADQSPLPELQPYFVGTPRMTAPAAWLAQGLSVSLQTTVLPPECSGSQWHLRSAEHGLLQGAFDAVVLAVPAPQAVPLLAPTAPALADMAASAQMQGCWALMLRFEAPVSFVFDGAFVRHSPLRWVARDSSKPGRGGTETWVLQATSAWSQTHMEDAPEEVAAALLAAFAALGGPTPAAWTAHRWRYADAQPALTQGCAWDSNLRLGLCGDWLHGGGVQGAWLSGQALARQLLPGFER